MLSAGYKIRFFYIATVVPKTPSSNTFNEGIKQWCSLSRIINQRFFSDGRFTGKHRHVPEHSIAPSSDLLELENDFVPDWSLKSSKKVPRKAKGFQLNGEMLFGYHPVLLALQQRRRKFFKIYLKEMSAPSQRHAEIQCLAKEMDIPVQFMDVPTLDYICQRPIHQGVSADVTPLKTLDVEKLPFRADECAQVNAHPVWLVLYNIHDPMNLGAVLRSAYYFGVDRIFRTLSNCCSLTPVVSKASSGVMELVDVFAVKDLQGFLKEYQNSGWHVIGTTCDKLLYPVQDITSFQLEKPSILLLGNEGSGLDDDLTNMCNHLISIPPAGEIHPNVGSLNVSVAAGIILFQLLHPTLKGK